MTFPKFPLNKVNLDPLKLDLPTTDKLKILKKQNIFLFQSTEEERQATDRLRSYIKTNYKEFC